MSVLLSYSLGTQPFTIALDATVNENHGGSAEISKHPVEKGASNNDNIRPLPLRLTLEAMVTETPIYPDKLAPSSIGGATTSVKLSRGHTLGSITSSIPSAANVLNFASELERVPLVYDRLVVAMQQGALFEINTSLTRYENFAIANLSVPRNAQNSNAIQFTIDFEEIRIVDVVITNGLAQKKTKKATRRGNKPPKEVKTEEKEPVKQGLAHALLKGVAH